MQRLPTNTSKAELPRKILACPRNLECNDYTTNGEMVTFRVPGSRFRVQGSGFKVPGAGFRVPDSEFLTGIRAVNHCFT